MSKRCAIVGTASSWKETPWNDPTIRIKTLNDGYALGIPRSDEHYDLHPFEKMWFRPKEKRTFKEGEIPPHSYIRPEQHLEWLKERAKTIPVWLQADPPDGWPENAKRFPREDVEHLLKARPDQAVYIASSPVLELAHAIVEGYTWIGIYGIHLATQAEYLKQRPNFEWLIGKAQAMGIEIHLPASCPLLKHTHVYAYESEPIRPDEAARRREAKLSREYQQVVQALVDLPRWKSKAPYHERLARLRAEIRDAQMQGKHALVSAGAI